MPRGRSFFDARWRSSAICVTGPVCRQPNHLASISDRPQSNSYPIETERRACAKKKPLLPGRAGGGAFVTGVFRVHYYMRAEALVFRLAASRSSELLEAAATTAALLWL